MSNRSIMNKIFKFGIYRKPTLTDAIIRYGSNYNYSQNIKFFK
jgi:hypothetical protein